MNLIKTEQQETTSFELWKKINEFRSQGGQNKIQHSDFLARVEDECDDLGVSEIFVHPQNKQKMKCYRMNSDQMLLVGMRESKGVRKKVLEWLKTLSENQAPALPQTFADALQLAADQARKIEEQNKALEVAAPKVEFVDRYTDASGLKGFREACKLLGVKENVFRRFLIDEGIMYRLAGKMTAYAKHIDAGRFETKTGENGGHAYTSCKFTPKGITWISQLWSEHENYYLGDE